MLREGVRGKFSFQNISGANELISNWLVLSLVVATAFISAVWWHLTYLGSSVLEGNYKLFFYCYIGSFFLQVFLECFLTTYHAGAYAIWRIYRPFKWFFGVAAFNFLLLMILWKLLGAIGLPIAFTLGLLLSAGVRFYYISETYRKLGLNPLNWPGFGRIKIFLLSIPWKRLVGSLRNAQRRGKRKIQLSKYLRC